MRSTLSVWTRMRRTGAIRVCRIVLALAVISPSAVPLVAQRSPQEAQAIESYRLTMPALRKVLPAVYARGASRCERPESKRDVASLSLAEMTRVLERCAPVMQQLRRAGVPPRDAAVVLASLHRTGQAVAQRSGNAHAVPPGVLRDNALLLEANGTELRRLMNEERPS